MNQNDAERILDLAHSETKSWGGDEASLTHAAKAIARKWPEEFKAAFGEDGAKQIDMLLRRHVFEGDRAQLDAILRQNDSIETVVSALHRALESDLTGLAEPDVSPAESVRNATATQPALGRPVTGQPTDEKPSLAERLDKKAVLVEPAGGDGPRSREAAEIAAHTIRSQWVVPAIVGPSGVGKTHMLGAVAAKLAGIPRPRSVWRIASEVAEINPVSALRAVLAQIDEPALVVLDDFETHAGLDANQPDRDLMAAIISASDHPFARIAVVVDQRFDARIGLLSPAFDMALERVQVNQLAPSLVDRIVRERADQLSAAQGVTIEDAAEAAALTAPMSRESGVHPGLAISRLDAAVARAVIAGERSVRVEHLASDGAVTAREGTRTFEELLREGVKGQDEAIEKVASRLALTRVGIDLRPERPNGVFLFVGPTGVGKTQLAKEIALHEYGGADRIIRIDMSEYAHGSASSKLIGSGPGYIGSDQPEGWLTTKVAQMPRSVVLLDEIEKADPSIWNNFLQVFDAGRMTDGRGVTVSFADTIIVMTSNLGVREASLGVAGFGNATDAGDMSARILSVVRNEMAPELLNRIDEIIPFNALSLEAILEITHKELADARTRLLASGWTVDWTDDVPRWLAETGYDPAYGARHLQRNIEHELLTRLARLARPHMTVCLADGTLAVRGG